MAQESVPSKAWYKGKSVRRGVENDTGLNFGFSIP
jgi:hypothetical protein